MTTHNGALFRVFPKTRNLKPRMTDEIVEDK